MKALKNPLLDDESSQVDRRYHSEKHLRKFCDVTSQALTKTLGALIGELEFAQQDKKASLNVVADAAEKALGLARNLRFFSVHSRFDIQPVDISQIVLDTIDLIEKDLEAQKIQLSVFVDASVHGSTDLASFQQILLNLFANASNVMPDGGKLSVSLRQYNAHLEITCTNTGVGNYGEDLEEIFEPTIHPNERGLGLAVARALSEALGGEISVAVEKEKGTTFRLRLPFDPKSPKPALFGDKRRFQRVSVSFPAEIRLANGKTYSTELTTLSSGGGYILLPESNTVVADISDTIELKIYYYQKNFVLVPYARIASVFRVGPNAGYGLEFSGLDSKARIILSALVKSLTL